MRIQFLLILISDNALGLAKFMNYYSPFAVLPIAQLLNDDLPSSSFQDTKVRCVFPMIIWCEFCMG